MATTKKPRRKLLRTPIGTLQFPKLREADEYQGKRSYSATLVIADSEAKPLQERILQEFDEVAPDFIGTPAKAAKARNNVPWGPALDREKKEIPGFTAIKFRIAEFYTSKAAKAQGKVNDIDNRPVFYGRDGAVIETESVPKFGFGTTCRIQFDVFPYEGFGGGINLRPREVQLLDLKLMQRQGQGFADVADESDEPSEVETGADETPEF